MPGLNARAAFHQIGRHQLGLDSLDHRMDLYWDPHVRIGRTEFVFLDPKVRHRPLEVLKNASEHLAIYFYRDEILLQACDAHHESRQLLPFVQFLELRSNPVPFKNNKYRTSCHE